MFVVLQGLTVILITRKTDGSTRSIPCGVYTCAHARITRRLGMHANSRNPQIHVCVYEYCVNPAWLPVCTWVFTLQVHLLSDTRKRNNTTRDIQTTRRYTVVWSFLGITSTPRSNTRLRAVKLCNRGTHYMSIVPSTLWKDVSIHR
jgi:hypothetical protein